MLLVAFMHVTKIHARTEGSEGRGGESMEQAKQRADLIGSRGQQSSQNCTKEEASLSTFAKKYPNADRRVRFVVGRFMLREILRSWRGSSPRAEATSTQPWTSTAGHAAARGLASHARRFERWKEENVPAMARRVEKLPEFIWNCGEAKDGSGLLFVQGAMYDPQRGSSQDYAVYTVKVRRESLVLDSLGSFSCTTQKMLEIEANSTLRLTVLIDVRAGVG
eukprot:765322-Hanusia_phi.AAC.3